MQFGDVGAAGAWYAARYAEYAAGRLHPQQLDLERQSLLVVDPNGTHWRMDPSGRWAPEPPTPPRRSYGRYLAAGAGLVALLVLVGVLARGGDDGQQSATPSGRVVARAPGLAGVLQTGGVVVYLRHAERQEVAEQVTAPGDCGSQANLTAAGQAQARRAGAALRALGVRVATVAASPYCRTRDTATLAFGRAPTLVAELAGATLVPPVPPDARRAAVLRLFSAAPPAGQIGVVVGHGEVAAEVLGVGDLGFAELAVFRPGAGGPVLLGRLTYDDLVAVACTGGAC
jgi:phosphohistidine phosphatase SixA